MLMLPTPTSVIYEEDDYNIIRFGRIWDENYNEIPRILCSIRNGVVANVYTVYGRIILPVDQKEIYQ